MLAWMCLFATSSLIFQVLAKADIAHICYKMCFVPGLLHVWYNDHPELKQIVHLSSNFPCLLKIFLHHAIILALKLK